MLGDVRLNILFTKLSHPERLWIIGWLSNRAGAVVVLVEKDSVLVVMVVALIEREFVLVVLV